jgi:cephalosporin hydroxylase
MSLRGRARRWLDRKGSRLPSLSDAHRDRLSMTLADWIVYHQDAIVMKRASWMGVRALKNPLDMWIYQEILHEVKPDVLVEIGSFAGGSTLYFAHLFDLMGRGSVLSVDIDRSLFEVEHPRIRCLTGDSASPEIVEQVHAQCAGRSALVIHDGDHTREHVTRDLEAYAPLVGVGSYLIVEDSIVDLFDPGQGPGQTWEGPLPAIDDFLRDHPEFVVDAERERYLLTYNPRGFLRRVR